MSPSMMIYRRRLLQGERGDWRRYNPEEEILKLIHKCLPSLSDSSHPLPPSQ